MATKLFTPTNVIRFLSVGLFLVSLACPCYDTEKEAGEIGQGAELLLIGILWFIMPSPGFLWLANPLLLFSWIYAAKKRGRSFILSMIALVIAFCFLLYHEMLLDESGSNFTPIIAHRIGYWLWLASISTMLLGSFYLQLTSAGYEKAEADPKSSAGRFG